MVASAFGSNGKVCERYVLVRRCVPGRVADARQIDWFASPVLSLVFVS